VYAKNIGNAMRNPIVHAFCGGVALMTGGLLAAYESEESAKYNTSGFETGGESLVLTWLTICYGGSAVVVGVAGSS